MSTTTKLCKDASRKNVEKSFYRSMIGNLFYHTTSHPNISFNVISCARYQANPKESHLTTIKRIICYINGTLDYGLWYPYDFSLVIIGYFNVDQVRHVEDRKNTFDASSFY